MDAGAQVLIAPRCGENAAQVLEAAGVKLFQSVGGTAQENLDALLLERLRRWRISTRDFIIRGEEL